MTSAEVKKSAQMWHHAGVAASAPDSPPSVAGVRPPFWVTLVATSFGAGFMPGMPGHTGTLTAVAMAWGLAHAPAWLYGIVLLFIIAIGTIASELWGQSTGVPDDQRIVVDEVVGYLATLMFVPRTWPTLIVAFFLFRLLDVWKPGPIGKADRTLGGGVGVMADDLVAGVIGALIMIPLYYSGAIGWVTQQLMRVVG
ncbi:MAG: phosphatidylglycerophosphatase [Myxococcales bacterium]|nr:phosphatidylglycerophosphatase [Myxococcales bacterium]